MTKKMIKNTFRIIVIFALCIACNRADDPVINDDEAIMSFALSRTIDGDANTSDQAIKNCRIYLFEAGTSKLVDYFYSDTPNADISQIKMKALFVDQNNIETGKMDLYVLLNFPNEGVDVTDHPNSKTKFDRNTSRNDIVQAEWLWTEIEESQPLPRVLMKKDVVSTEGTTDAPYVLKVPAILTKVSIRIAKQYENSDNVQIENIRVGNFPSSIYVVARTTANYPPNAILENQIIDHTYSEGNGTINNVLVEVNGDHTGFEPLQICYIPEYIALDNSQQQPYNVTIDYVITVGDLAIDNVNTLELVSKNSTPALADDLGQAASIVVRNNHIQINYTVAPIEIDTQLDFDLSISDMGEEVTDIPDFE